MQHFNQLTPAEAERMALLMEECAEVIMIAGKILRHGFDSTHPGDRRVTNRTMLTLELGHVLAALDLQAEAGDVYRTLVEEARAQKRQTVQKWLHHAGDSADADG